MNSKGILVFLFLIMHSVAELLISSISLTNDTISQIADYTFQIVRYGTIIQIPANTKVQISFPNQYAYSTVTSCTPMDWAGATSLTCSYSQLKLIIQNGFPVSSSLQDFSVKASGIRNPTAAKSYSPFSVRLIFPNATSENGTGVYSITITTALAMCSMTLTSGVVFGQGVMTINYQSQYINNSGSGYLMKLSMLQSYPSDPTNADVSPILSVSNTMLTKYLFEFSFTTSFNLTMKMPPSTQPEQNFIYLMTSNVLGDYDKCYISIGGVQPNTFKQLSFSGAQVQSLSSLQITFLTNTPILQSDLIRINFQNTDFDISQVSSYATFINGAIGQRQVTVANQTLTIGSISSLIIVSQVGFILNNIKFPYSTKTQDVTIYIQTDNGFIRDRKTHSYTSSPGTIINPSFTCLINQIGYNTSCTLIITLKNEIKNTSYIQIQFASGFRIVNGYAQCITTGNGLNTISNCNSYALTNSIRVSGLTSSSFISPNSNIQITIPSLTLPTRPDQYVLNISTRTSTDSIIDTAVLTFTTISRLLLSSQVSISSSSLVTSAISSFTVTFTLPISLGVPFVLNLYIPFINVSSISVNGNLLQSSYSTSSSLLTIQNVGNTPMTITGFITYQSTAPITLSGNLTFNNTLYFYFTGYDISMTTPRQINVFNFVQSNQIVGKTFKADIIISDLKANDIIKIPSTYYALSQSDCSSNSICSPNGKIVIQQINNYGTNLTKISANLINNGYISSSSFDLYHYDPTGIFYKQVKTVTINTQVLNILNISALQSNPYYTEVSTYTFDVTMTTTPPTSSLNNLLAVKVPPQYTILDWSCVFGCIAPLPPIIQNTIYFQFSSINLKFTIKLTNPVSFLSAFEMTSSSLGDMDYGTYTPVSPCQVPCRSCDSNTTSYCLSCYLWKSQNKLRNGTCVSNCSASQYYQNESLSCQSCHNYCLSCVNTSTTCYTCRTGYYYFQLSCLVDCPAAYYKTSTFQCGICQQNCLNCTSATICTKCQNGSYLYSQSCWASCQQGTYINPIVNQCLNCSEFCATCDSTGCSRCYDNYYLYNKRCFLNCPNGLYKNVTTCQACQSPCSSCSIFSTNCTSCVINISSTYYYYLSNRCYQNRCPETYYISPLDNSCLQCQSPCLTCNRTSCIICQPNLYFYNGFCSSQCQIGTYPTINLTCVKCVNPCSTCSSQNSCLSCLSPYFLYNSTCILTCPEKFYQGGDNICKSCVSPCFTCSSQSICKSCLTLSFFNGTCLSTCLVGYYSTSYTLLNATLYQCVLCVSPCQSCISQTLCLSCTNNLKLFNNTCQQSCPSLYYDQNGMCFLCSYPCRTCNSSGCLTCATNSLYLQQQSCVQSCSALHPNNQTMICQACKSPCASCTWSDTCLSCLSGFIYYGQQCIRTCPSGMYNSNSICVTCPTFCSTCYLFGDQIRCPTCKEGNYFFGYDCVSSCPSTTTLEGPYCLSASCSSLTDCMTCTNLRCLQCNTNFTLNSNTQKCQVIPVQTSTISAISEIPVPFPFLIATALIIVSAFLIRLSFDKMFAPLFIYSFVGIAECGVIALWIALIYIRGINSNTTGTLLRIAATVLAGIYVLFNIIGFIFYLKVTRNDKKFRTWEKQDNKCTSITISIVALIFTFRFSILKYSKLGHLLRFSATLSNDQKLSHQNLLSFLAIFLINIPTIVVSAWVAYLQISMNYLFFTSIQVAILSVMMIVLSIVQSLSPKGYTLERRQDFKQGNDADVIDDHSLSEMMVKLGIVQQEYHENKEILSQEGQVEAKNDLVVKNDDYQYLGDNTRQALMFPKKQDEKLSIQSQLPSQNSEQNYYQGQNKNQNQNQNQGQDQDQKQDYDKNQDQSMQARTQEIKQELQNILMEAQRRAQHLNRPSRPVGTIKKQSLTQLLNEEQSSQGIQSDDQPPQINNVKQVRTSKDSSLKKQEVLDLKQLKNFLQIQQRRLGMRKLQHLFQKLKMQQQQQKQLMQRLDKVTQQQKKVKKQQYQKARQLIQRNQMNVQQKISRVQKLMSQRIQNQKQRKQKIKQLQKKRKQDRVSRTAEKSVKNAMIYPINQQINQSGLGEKNIASKRIKNERFTNQNKQIPQSEWNQDQNGLNFNQNQWKMKSQRLSPSLVQQQPPSKQKPPQLKPDKTQSFEDYQQSPHWPLDPELTQKISQVQEKARMYIKRPRPNSQIEQYDMDLEQQQQMGTGGGQIVFKQQDESAFNQDENQRKAQQQIISDIKLPNKIPKRRINRSVINLAPGK